MGAQGAQHGSSGGAGGGAGGLASDLSGGSRNAPLSWRMQHGKKFLSLEFKVPPQGQGLRLPSGLSAASLSFSLPATSHTKSRH